MSPEIEKWMPEARQLAAQCWCDKETEGLTMDTRLAEACAIRIAAWMSTAAQMSNDAEFYRNIVKECGEAIGVEAYTSDDGSVQQDVLALKVPELVKKLIKNKNHE